MGRIVPLSQERSSQDIRDQFAQVSLVSEDFVLPIFVCEKGVPAEIPSLPGVIRYTVDQVVDVVRQAYQVGIKKFLFFGVVDAQHKTYDGNYASHPDNPCVQAVEVVSQCQFPIEIIVDICLCGYTDHGHCGVVESDQIDWEKSRQQYVDMALILEKAGAHAVMPTACCDGQVHVLRQALKPSTKIISCSVKYASALYGPFRDATQCGLAQGQDRKQYQLDFRNVTHSYQEPGVDFQEGADSVVVKPILWYLDIAYRIKQLWPEHDLYGYHVSGSYHMLMETYAHDDAYRNTLLMEAFIAMKRGGVDFIISYSALLFCQEVLNG